MATKIKRSLFKTFLRTGSVGTPAWALIADGVSDASIEYSPKTSEETYIDADSATVSLESYAPTLPIEATAKHGDTVFDFIDALRKARSVLTDAEFDVVNVWLYKTNANGYYSAEKQSCSIQVDKFGGPGGESAKINYTVNFLGNPTKGIFKPAATAAFAARPVLTALTTLVIGSVTLTPLFATDHSNLLYTGSVSNGTTVVAMTSTLTGATIVQKEGANVVNQGANATLAVGVNHLSVEVTVGAEVVTYYIDITRAAS